MIERTKQHLLHGLPWLMVGILLTMLWQAKSVGAAPEVNSFQDTLERRVATLEEMLEHFSREGDDIYITGANLHVRNDTGTTDGTPDGLGNVIIGYNELRGTDDDRSGSHMLVVGNELNYSSFGGLVVGQHNETSGRFSTVSGGRGNTASGDFSTVSAGNDNTASGSFSTVSAGNDNTASGFFSTVSAGNNNTASGSSATVSGGEDNTASDTSATVSGGVDNTASGHFSTVSAGAANTASDDTATVSGGEANTASGAFSTVSSGRGNEASGDYSTVSGGRSNEASGFTSTVSGGRGNTASGTRSTVSGGLDNTASGPSSTVSGGQGNTASLAQSHVPSPEAGSITVDDLIGIWQSGTVVTQFYEDGTFRSANSVNLLESLPAAIGQFQLDGNELSFITSEESSNCEGLNGHYQVQLTEQGELQLELQDDPCNSRHYEFTNEPWSRNSP